MVNEVNNEAEASKTGDAPTVEKAPEQNAAPIAAPIEQIVAETAAPSDVPDTPAKPRTVAKPKIAEPVAAAAEEPQASGDIDFGAILEQFEQDQTHYHVGDLVEGKVVGVSERGALIDFGYKSEGIVAAEELAATQEELSVGDTVEVVIKSMPAGDAPPSLSRSDATQRKVWNDIEDAYKADTPVVGKIIDKTKGGLRVDLNGIEAFLPGSQIDSRPARGLDSYIGQDIEAKIIKFSRRRNNIVLSRKVITDLVINEQKAATLAKVDIGYVVEGTVKNLTEYGAFVDIGGIDGLLHVTDMSWGRLNNPADQFKVNDRIQVKILKLDREREKISLGYKQLLPDPWSTVVESYPVNTKINGKVSSVTEYGIFVELEPGVEGLVHVSEISWSKRAANPKRMFNRGDDVEVQVLGVDTEEKRISLGMKQLQDNPWHNIEDRYPVGTKIHGKVRNLTDFGAFVEVEDGIDGLVHVSDITWAKKIKHPKDLLKKDQEVDAIVTNIDAVGQRLSLSMKDLTPSAWEGFVATHRPGDVVRGKVSRFTSFGIFVELGDGLEGLCHISELSDERVESAESVASLGQEMDFKILRIENEDQKIGLSHRAVGKESEPVVDTRVFSSEAKSGMASLGELANLMKGAAAEEPKPEMTKEEREEAKKAKKEKAKQEYEASLAREVSGEEAAAADEAAEPEAEALASTDGDASVESASEAEEPTADAAPTADGEASTEEASSETQAAEPVAEAPAAESEAAEEPVAEAAAEDEAAAATETDAADPVTEESVEPSAEAGSVAQAVEETPTEEIKEDNASSEAAADETADNKEESVEKSA
ncbi:MAG TPA: 30S ribosomal protein S1 [Pyrinomonadaceae bacterium]|nr:30S ribosomal protein S1 [Pyrinomonadaceae bacterium]